MRSGKAMRVRRQAVGAGADRVAEVARRGIGDGQDVDRARQHDLVARLPADGGRVASRGAFA